MQPGILPRGLYNNKPQIVCAVLFLRPECVLSVSCVSRVFCLCVISLATKIIIQSSGFETWWLIRNISGTLEEKGNTWALVVFKKFQDNSNMYLDFKK